MLSKEEISKLKINAFNQCDDETIRLVAEMLNHTEQLESDKQKLIEKLEEDKKIFGNYEERKQMEKEQLYENDGKWFYCQEILSILKGEKNDNQARIYRNYK